MARLHPIYSGQSDRPAILFVHGLDGHWLETWRHDACSKDDCWPHWVGEETGCDIWSLEYDAALSGWLDQAMPLPDQGSQVMDLLASAPALKGKPLVFVTHSLGGILVKTALVYGAEEDRRFQHIVDHVLGVVFIATPHSGAQLATLARVIKYLLRINPPVGNLEHHDPHLRTLNRRYQTLVKERGIEGYVYAEKRGVKIGPRGFGGWLRRIEPTVMVVDPGSTDPSLPEIQPISLAEDHISICKPPDRQQQIHLSLCHVLKEKIIPLAGDRGMGTTGVGLKLLESGTAQENPAAHMPPGRLVGPDDNRLSPREGKVYGRKTQENDVLAFLKGSEPVKVVGGVAGVGKTEVCKAALKTWLHTSPRPVAYYVRVPDRARSADLVLQVGKAVGIENCESLAQLLGVIPVGLYYLDNLESVADDQEGRNALRDLAQKPGVRILASSRTRLDTIFGAPIEIKCLSAPDALALFRDLWPPTQTLPKDDELQAFVIGKLGGHALSLVLVARLGMCLSFDALRRRWDEEGAALACDGVEDDTRTSNLTFNLRLTAEVLAPTPGALSVWVLMALFEEGIPEAVLEEVERRGQWPTLARHRLAVHHLISKRGDRWFLPPPVARYARYAAVTEQDGFCWRKSRQPILDLFLVFAEKASSFDSSPETLKAKKWILEFFNTISIVIECELESNVQNKFWLNRMSYFLRDIYQQRIAVSPALLRKLADAGIQPANTLRSLGDLASRLGQVDKARSLYEKAVDLYRIEQEPLGLAYSLTNLALCFEVLKNLSKRNQVLKAAFVASRDANNEIVQIYLKEAIPEMPGADVLYDSWLKGQSR